MTFAIDWALRAKYLSHIFSLFRLGEFLLRRHVCGLSDRCGSNGGIGETRWKGNCGIKLYLSMNNRKKSESGKN